MTLRVFLVDDLIGMQALMRDVVAAVGAMKLVATAVGEGEAKLWLEDHAGEWDLAVIDLVLQEGTGMRVIARCRETHPRGTVVVFSSYVSPVIRQHCLQLGADAVFNKDETGAFLEWLGQQQAAGGAGGGA